MRNLKNERSEVLQWSKGALQENEFVNEVNLMEWREFIEWNEMNERQWN